MRRLVITLLVSIPSLVRAQPGLTGATEPEDEPITSYVQPGAIVGLIHANSANSDAAYGALSLEGGHRIGISPVWLHGLVAVGGMGDLDQGSGPNSYSEVVAGVESRTCAFHGIACGVAAIDVGIRHEYLMSDHFDSFNGVIVPRLGLDIGSRKFRVRPAIEYVFGTDGYGAALSLAGAYTW